MRTNDALDWNRIVGNIPKTVWQNLQDINFNGTTGDNIMHPDIAEIVSWCSSHSPARINIHTNGSLRTGAWWAQFGSQLANVPHKVVFGLDGLADTHSVYRINTDFDKIITNAQAFIQAGGQAEWQFIVFEHNAHQIEQAQQLSRKLGFSRFFVLYQDRFAESADLPVRRYTKDLKQISAEIVVNPSSNSMPSRIAQSNQIVSCRSQRIGWFSIYADGTVWPCCWLMGWHRAQHQPQSKLINYHFQKILGIDFDQISLYNNTLESIVNSDLWQHRLPDSFKRSPNPVCIQQCSGIKHDSNT